jgi:hypothetical protein
MMVPDSATIAESYLRLGKAGASKVFPLRFMLLGLEMAGFIHEYHSLQ